MNIPVPDPPDRLRSTRRQLRLQNNKKGRILAEQGAVINQLKANIDDLMFILRDLVTDEEAGLHESGELWLRAKQAVAEYDAEICCVKIPCVNLGEEDV